MQGLCMVFGVFVRQELIKIYVNIWQFSEKCGKTKKLKIRVKMRLNGIISTSKIEHTVAVNLNPG